MGYWTTGQRDQPAGLTCNHVKILLNGTVAFDKSDNGDDDGW